jgi:hypothetical protein
MGRTTKILGSNSKIFFYSPNSPDQFWGTPSLLYSGGKGTLSMWVKWLMYGAKHPPPFGATLRMCRAIPPFHNMPTWRLIKHGDNFTFHGHR